MLRRKAFSDRVLAIYRRILPDMSQTEQEAIDAGTVWWDGELFSGKPDWDKLLAMPRAAAHRRGAGASSTARAKSCARWSTTGRSRTSCSDLPPHVWQYIKDKGFLGMIIPKEYGGLGFSALRALAGGDEARRRARAPRRSP